MTDGPQGPGWWQASDGNWYPPEQHPNYEAPPPVPPPRPAEWPPPEIATAPTPLEQLARRPPKWPLAVALVAAIVVILAAAGITFKLLQPHSPAPQTPTAQPAAPSRPTPQPAAPSRPTAQAAPPSGPTAQPAPPSQFCRASSCAFLSPIQSLNCEIHWETDDTQTYCQTNVPPQSVHMDTNGTVRSCVDVVHSDMSNKCDIGNPGYGPGGVPTPTLAYGLTLSLGPFTCLSAASGVTCTVTSGRGFTISGSGITPVG
jgi:hypothetical protein